MTDFALARRNMVEGQLRPNRVNDAGLLAVVPVKGLRMQRPLYRVQLKTGWISPPMRAFLDLLEIRSRAT